MTSTETPATCSNCASDIQWVAPEPGDGHGFWIHVKAAPGNLGRGACRPGNYTLHATPAPGHEHIGPGETEPTPGEGFALDLFNFALTGLNPEDHAAAAADYTRRRAAELIEQLPATAGNAVALCHWAGHARVILAELTGNTGLL